MKRTAALSAAGVTALLLSSLTPVSAVEPTVWIVDDDKANCPEADFTSIQAAVNQANPGDTVQVCPGTYRERVVVDKTLTLEGATKVQDFNCFDFDFSALDHTKVSIMEPPDTTAGNLLRLAADNIDVSGFVLQKQQHAAVNSAYEAALETDSGHFGYNIHENIFYENNLGVEFGSSGIIYGPQSEPIGGGVSTFQDNCLRANRFALANQRLELKDALIADNESKDTTEKAYELGTGLAGAMRVTLADNTSRDDRSMVSILRRSSGMTITGNTVDNTANAASRTFPQRSIELRHQSVGLKITDNTLQGANIANAGIAFVDLVFSEPITGAEISGNQITGYAAGISFQGKAAATGNTFTENNTSGNVQYGILVSSGNTGNTFTGNVANRNGTAGIQAGSNSNTSEENTADDNGTAGIRAAAGTSGNTFNGNSMHRNGGAGLAGMADAVDLSGNPVLNTWTGNSCTTDIPDGLCALP